MKDSQNKKTLQIVLVVLIAVLTLGIGYASISAINLIINGNATASVNQDNFKVYFVPTADTPSLTGNVTLTGSATIDTEDNTIAHFNVSGLTKEGDYAIATYTIINNSEAIGAEIILNLTNSNTEYFKVTETITNNILQAGDTTTGTIKVEMIKTPIDTEVSTNVIGTLTATPMENAQASGGEEKTVPIQYVYTIKKSSSDIYMNYNQALPNEIRVYKSFAAAKQEYGEPMAIAHLIKNGIISETYMVVEVDNKEYYFRGFINEQSLDDTPIYDENNNKLKTVFGENNCTEYERDDNYNRISCYYHGIGNGFGVDISNDGSIFVHNYNYSKYCNIFKDGRCGCTN